MAANVRPHDDPNRSNVPAVLTNLVDSFVLLYVDKAEVGCVVFRGGIDAIRVGFAVIAHSLALATAQITPPDSAAGNAVKQFLSRGVYSGKTFPEFFNYDKCCEAEAILDTLGVDYAKDENADVPSLEFGTPLTDEPTEYSTPLTAVSLPSDEETGPIRMETYEEHRTPSKPTIRG